jgi:putative ABC transport system ATP-binding protein
VPTIVPPISPAASANAWRLPARWWQPSVILADEPTGNLDSTTAQEIMDLLLALNREQQVTLIIVTHDPHIAERLERKILVRNGVVQEAGCR